MFNHRPFIQGEIKHFVKEFEEKRKDREVEKVFQMLEHVTELRDCEVDKLRAQCDSTMPNVNANLLVAQSMCAKILDQGCGAEIDQALESSRIAREKEWNGFMKDIQDKCARIDDAYKRREEDILKQYTELEKQLHK